MGDIVYAVAKYIPDLFRQEPRNVGLIVAGEGRALLRFLGDDDGRLDLRSARMVQADGSLYAEWFAYWRRAVERFNRTSAEPATFLERLYGDGDTFCLWEGGEYIPDYEGQPLDEIAEKLFARLVQRPEEERVAREREGRTPKQLFREVRATFRQRGLLAADTEQVDDLGSEHLIRVRAPVPGTAARFRPNFSQRNGVLTVMENIDYSLTDAERATEHALYTATMFDDVRQANSAVIPVELIVIVHAVEGMNENAQKAGRAALGRVGDVATVAWDDSSARERFLAERAHRAGLH